MTRKPGEEYVQGRCTNCGHEEDRTPEELEPGSECPVCHQLTFGAA